MRFAARCLCWMLGWCPTPLSLVADVVVLPAHLPLVFLPCSPPPAEFDAAFLLGELPKVLDIEDRRVRMLLKELVGTRK